MWCNYHMHNDYCDGKGSLMDYVDRAKDLNLYSIGFSSHAPLPFENAWCMKAEKLPEYLQKAAQLRISTTSLQIYRSLEIDYIPRLISPKNFERDLDYTIGSIHFVEQFDDGRRWEIDGTHTFFLEGLEKIFSGNIKDVIRRYYELTREMITQACPNIIGHLDKIKIQNINNKLYDEQAPWYQQEITSTLDLVADAGAIIEVNTRGIYQKKSTSTYPGPWVLEQILKRNIPITLSSDAHHPDDIVSHFSETAKLLYAIGFKKLTILREGLWKSFPFDEHGIKIS